MPFAESFERHHAAVLGYLSRRVGSRADAEDLAQDVFLRAHRAAASYRESGQEAAWLFRIARNVLLNFRRDSARRPAPLALDSSDAPLPLVRPGEAEPLDLERGLAALPPHEAEAFLLREVAGLGYEEIAAVTDTTADAVRNRIFRARQALRATLGAREATSSGRPRHEHQVRP